MKTFISYPSIGQFRNALQDIKLRTWYSGKDSTDNPIYDDSKSLPDSIEFRGTIKLHGTNAGICEHDGEIWFQSRTAILEETDNCGFKLFYEKHLDYLKDLFAIIRFNHAISDKSIVSIFGEWCGGNIQKGVALNSLPKMFVIFGIKETNPDDLEDTKWHNPLFQYKEESLSIYNVEEVGVLTEFLNPNRPDFFVEKVKQLTDSVEKECPFSKMLGVSGIGEGIVWTTTYMGKNIRFKSKGDKHSAVKSKSSVSVDVEKVNSIQDFVEYTVTENRLNQALEQVFTITGNVPSQKFTGDFIKWIIADIIKEESDTLEQNGLTPKDVNSAISNKARNWFFKYLETN